ncbi:hypothetical protein Hamer_G027385 [Homarus americanus]|uniref:Uncharacterized protein n=1 Tax=Homarus americanus TaxID=6706 RepID=A0A8J5K0X7_HOMAM|nr:hypothetical protein Hamer_G027385 [Homarus americanus]
MENQLKEKDAIPLQLSPTEIAADSVTTVEQSSETGGDVTYSDTGATAAAEQSSEGDSGTGDKSSDTGGAVAAAEQSFEGGAVADLGTAEKNADIGDAVADSDIGVNYFTLPNSEFYDKIMEKRKKRKVLAENLPLCGNSAFEQITNATGVSVPVDTDDRINGWHN